MRTRIRQRTRLSRQQRIACDDRLWRGFPQWSSSGDRSYSPNHSTRLFVEEHPCQVSGGH